MDQTTTVKVCSGEPVYPDDRWRPIRECLGLLRERGDKNPEDTLSKFLETEASAPLIQSRATRLYEVVNGKVSAEFRHCQIPPYFWYFRGPNVVRGPYSFASGDLISCPNSSVTWKAEEILVDFVALERTVEVQSNEPPPEPTLSPRQKRSPIWLPVALAVLDMGLAGELHTKTLGKYGAKEALIDAILASRRMPPDKPSRASIRAFLGTAMKGPPETPTRIDKLD